MMTSGSLVDVYDGAILAAMNAIRCATRGTDVGPNEARTSWWLACEHMIGLFSNDPQGVTLEEDRVSRTLSSAFTLSSQLPRASHIVDVMMRHFRDAKCGWRPQRLPPDCIS